MKAWRPPAAAAADIRAQRERLAAADPGDIPGWARCAGCRHQFPLRSLDLSHRDKLGRRATRYDRDHPLNSDENAELRCRPCHVAWEEHERAVKSAERAALSAALRDALKRPR